jgi:hypothetical protein
MRRRPHKTERWTAVRRPWVYALLGLLGWLPALAQEPCDYAVGAQQVCVPGHLSSGIGSLDAAWCSNTGDLEVWVQTPAPSYGYVVTGPKGYYGHVTFIQGQLCVGGPQWRHVDQLWWSHTGAPTVFRVDAHLGALRGTKIYIQGWWKDYSDGQEAFTNAQMLVIP